MKQCVKAEHLKMKHTFARKLPFVAAVLNLLLALLLVGGAPKAFPAGVWNWWYSILLPGMLAIWCYLNMKKEKKINYFGMYALPLSMKQSFGGKIIYGSLYLFGANVTIWLGAWLGGSVLGTTITLLQGFAGAVCLTICYLWAIPLYLFLSARCGMFVSIFMSMVLSVSSVFFIADSDLWWVYLPAIPVRLMCPVLGILPNGLQVSNGSELGSIRVLVPGLLLSVLWFVVITILTMVWMEKMEAKE